MSFPMPDVSALSAPYWQALRDGMLVYQQCAGCASRWLPARSACPSCLGTELSWRTASGRGKVVSWVVYHVAYDDAFKDRLPYNVALVELEEGPRVLTNIVDSDAARRLRLDAPVTLRIEYEGDVALARFKLAD